MRPGEAVRQIEYVIDATTTDGGRRCAAGYRPAFERDRRRDDVLQQRGSL